MLLYVLYLLLWQEAKADIVDNDRSKLQLESDVRLLYNLLERAKKERRSYDVTIRQLERSVAASKAGAVEVSTGSTHGCRVASGIFLVRSSRTPRKQQPNVAVSDCGLVRGREPAFLWLATQQEYPSTSTAILLPGLLLDNDDHTAQITTRSTLL